MHAGQKLIRRFSLIITIHEAKYAYSYIGQGLMIWMMPGLGTALPNIIHRIYPLDFGIRLYPQEKMCKCLDHFLLFYFFLHNIVGI